MPVFLSAFIKLRKMERPARLFEPDSFKASPSRSQLPTAERVTAWLWKSSGEKRKRSPLDELSNNMGSGSPSKRRRRAKDGDTDDDDEPSVSSSASSLRKSSTSTRRRPSSPIHIEQLALGQDPIVMRSFAEPSPLPPGLADMVSALTKFSRGHGVVSTSQMASVHEAHALHREFHDVDEVAFGKGRDLLGPSPSTKDVVDIQRLAFTCEKKGHGEAHWNCRVHAPLFNLSLNHKEYQDKVDFVNCNEASIQPAALIPRNHLGKTGESKIVDFAICLEPSESVLDIMTEMAARCSESTFSINHTRHAPLLTSPISVSIATGESWDMAVVQMGVWVAAHFKKLTKLMADPNLERDIEHDMIPFLPIIIIQSHEWCFLAASKGKKVNMWTKVGFGSTSTVLGVYQIVASIQHLARWTKTVYRPWFYKHVLRMMQSEETEDED